MSCSVLPCLQYPSVSSAPVFGSAYTRKQVKRPGRSRYVVPLIYRARTKLISSLVGNRLTQTAHFKKLHRGLSNVRKNSEVMEARNKLGVTEKVAMGPSVGLFAFWSLAWTSLAGYLLNSHGGFTIPLPYSKVAVGVVSLVWLGMIMAISFMEAWVKFKAPFLTKAIAVDVGRHVFSALNSVEHAHAIAVITFAFLSGSLFNIGWVLYPVAVLAMIVGIQTIWLTPTLSTLACHNIASAKKEELPEKLHAKQGALNGLMGRRAKPSKKLHIFYVLFEVIKVCLLASVAIWSFANSVSL